MTQSEAVVLKLRQRLGDPLAQAVSQAQAPRPVAGRACPECQRDRRDQGRRRHTLESRVGGRSVERGNSSGQTCGRRVFPPG
ncbi:MAG: hypothetical protein ACRDGG_02930 [Anaerolineae bacterium]